jgi:hypothetical protein
MICAYIPPQIIGVRVNSGMFPKCQGMTLQASERGISPSPRGQKERVQGLKPDSF